MRVLRRLHRWFGLVLALPMLLQGLTGVLMLVLPLLPRGVPAVVPAGSVAATAAPPPTAEMLVALARGAAGPDLRAMSFAPPHQPGDAAEIGFGRASGRRPVLLVALDPRDGRRLAVHQPDPVFALVRRLHTELLVPVWGRTLIGWVGLGLLALAASGLVLWWPRGTLRQAMRWRRQFVVSRGARGRMLFRQLHVALGGWLWAMILLMGATGAIMSFPGVVNPLLGLPAGPNTGRGGSPPGRATAAPRLPPEAGLDRALAALAADGFGAERILEIGLAPAPAPLVARIALPEAGRGQILMVSVDRADGRRRILRDPRTRRGGQRVMAWVHALHQAELPLPAVPAAAWTVLVGLTGAALVLFSVSGVLSWVLGRRRRGGAAGGAE